MPLHRQTILQPMSPSPSPSMLKTIVLCVQIPQVEMTLYGMPHVEAVILQVTAQAGAKEDVQAIAQGAMLMPHSMEMTPTEAAAKDDVPQGAMLMPQIVEMTPTQAAAKENVPAIAQAGKVQGATLAQAEAKENVSVVAEAGVRAQGAMPHGMETPQRVMKVMMKDSATAGQREEKDAA